MPLTIQLETETGASLGEVLDLQDVVTSLAADGEALGLRIAHTIDPYGHTVLNRLQIRPMLLADLDVLLAGPIDDDEATTLRAVRTLAEQALAEPGLYLKFYGD